MWKMQCSVIEIQWIIKCGFVFILCAGKIAECQTWISLKHRTEHDGFKGKFNWIHWSSNWSRISCGKRSAVSDNDNSSPIHVDISTVVRALISLYCYCCLPLLLLLLLLLVFLFVSLFHTLLLLVMWRSFEVKQLCSFTL